MTGILTQRRAAFCYEKVTDWPENWRGDATTRIQGLPVQIRTQGLPVALATLIADNKPHTDRLSEILAHWLLAEAPHRPLGKGNQDRPLPADLLAACTRADRAAHTAAQREAILLCDQLKLFANALKAGDRS